MQWRLLTNREASTLEAVVELINWYCARWEIKKYFHVLKNGCRVEALQLSTIERMQRALVLYMVAEIEDLHLSKIVKTTMSTEYQDVLWNGVDRGVLAIKRSGVVKQRMA